MADYNRKVVIKFAYVLDSLSMGHDTVTDFSYDFEEIDV